jgi:hypothetical protein
MADTTTLAFLHAHGLNVEPKGLSAALRAALASLEARYFPATGEEGLTAGEIAVARSGGFAAKHATSAGEDPLLQGVAAYAGLLSTGLTTAAAAKRLKVSDARIRQRLAERTLLAVRQGRAWKLPVFQFTRKGELPGWGAVCAQLAADVSPVAVDRWISLPNPDLRVGADETAVSPHAWLVAGRPPEAVAALAAGV